MKSIFCHKAKAAPPAANTLRFEFSDQSYSPVTAGVGSSGTWKRFEFMPGNVWDWTKSNASWLGAFNNAFKDSSNVVDIIAAGDTSTVNHMGLLFASCSSLRSICLFDMSFVVQAYSMFYGCNSLEIIPDFNTLVVTNLSGFASNARSIKRVPSLKTDRVYYAGDMFRNCVNVESGALDLYKQMSTQATPPSSFSGCFSNCGRDTTTGAAELAQIPTSWGGTKEEA